MRFDQLGWHRAPVVKVSQGCVRVFRAGREHRFCRGFDTPSYKSRTIQAPFVSRDSNVLGDRRALAALGEVAGVIPILSGQASHEWSDWSVELRNCGRSCISGVARADLLRAFGEERLSPGKTLMAIFTPKKNLRPSLVIIKRL